MNTGAPLTTEPAEYGFRRPFAVLMFAASGSVVFFMAHHPTGHSAAGIAGMVHGAMLVTLMMLAIGFCHYALVRGLHRLPVLAGLASFVAGAGCNIGAATLNGFIAPTLAARESPPGQEIFLLIWESNQALATLGVVATGIAYVGWSIDLLRDKGTFDRVLAVSGLIAGLIPVVALASGKFGMDVTTAFVIYSAHAAWALAIAVLIWRRSA